MIAAVGLTAGAIFGLLALTIRGGFEVRPDAVTASVGSPANQTIKITGHPWPMVHGRADHTGYLPVLGPAQPTVAWKYWVGLAQGNPPNSAAIAEDGTIYVAGAHRLTALNSDGTEKWTQPVLNGQGPAIAADGTVVISGGQTIYAFTQTGTKLWEFPTGGELHFGPTLGPDGTIYQGAWDGFLYAISLAGKEQWRYQTTGAISYPPTVGADGTIYLGGGDAHAGPDRYIYALAKTGQLKWQFDTGTERVGSPAIGSDGTIYVPAAPALLALKPDGRLKWRLGPMVGGSVNLSPETTSPNWPKISQKGDVSGIITPAIGPDGTIYVGTSEGIMLAINPEGPSLSWQVATGADPNRPGFYGLPSFPVVDEEGTVYVGAVDGYLYAFSRSGELRWRFATGGPMPEAAPALGPDGRLYATSEDGYLYALGK